MPNGKPGDHPLTDMLSHGLHPFPADMEQKLREILALQPLFPDGRRPYDDQLKWMNRFRDWERGRNLEEGRQALQVALAELRNQKTVDEC